MAFFKPTHGPGIGSKTGINVAVNREFKLWYRPGFQAIRAEYTPEQGKPPTTMFIPLTNVAWFELAEATDA